MYKKLETERLLIRPVTTDDSEFIFKLVNSKGWIKFIGDRNIKNSNDAEKYIQHIIGNKNYFYSVFEIKETNQPIGIITLLNRVNQEFPDIGFALLPEYEKNGYAFEVSSKYLDEMKRNKISKKIFGITLPENERSIRLLKRLGLEFQHNIMKENETVSLYSLTIQ